MTSAEGVKANIAAATAIVCALGVTLAFVQWLPELGLGQALGAFAGAGTSTAALQAALAAFDNVPATGYSVAYPLGVAIPIILLGLYNVMKMPYIPPHAGSAMHVVEIEVDEFSVLGMTLGEVISRLPGGITIAAIRRGHRNLVQEDATCIEPGDVLLLTGIDRAVLHEVHALRPSTTGTHPA